MRRFKMEPLEHQESVVEFDVFNWRIRVVKYHMPRVSGEQWRVDIWSNLVGFGTNSSDIKLERMMASAARLTWADSTRKEAFAGVRKQLNFMALAAGQFRGKFEGSLN